MCGLLGFPSGELGPAVISRIGSKPGDYYENTYPRSGSLLFDVHRSYRIARLRPAHPSSHGNAAALHVTLQQVGANVVATRSGRLNLKGLTFLGPGQVTGGAVIGPNVPLIQTEPTRSCEL